MKITIKKMLLILALIISPSFCFGAEILNINLGKDYIITTESPISANVLGNPEILTIKPFFTIFNEKNIVLVHPEKVGKTKLTIFLKNSDVALEINVKPQNTPSTFIPYSKNGVDFSLLDEPPFIEDFELDFPPIHLEGTR